MAKKADLIKILVNEYGYEKDDIKLFTNAKLQAMVDQEKKDEEDAKAETTRMESKIIKIKDEDMIAVMSGTSGGFYYRSQQTGREWQFNDFGQIEKMSFRELVTLKNNSPSVFNDGYLLVLDRTVQEEFGLVEKYKNILTPDNIDSVFEKSVEELGEFIDALPKGMKYSFVSKARERYHAKKLDSVTKIEFIQKKFNISFDDNAPLNDVV